MNEPKFYPLLVRLRPRAKALLDEAAAHQLRSRASLIDEAILAMLDGKYTGLDDRLNAFLGRERE
jgi:uncharacterized protein (DUF1778 family)